MDTATKQSLDEFISYLAKEFAHHKHFSHIEVGNWHLKDFKVTVDIFDHGDRKPIYFDVREIKENRERFNHLLDNAFEQVRSNQTTY